MKVLVTGGSGFIGKRLVQSLVNNGCEVSVLSRRDNYAVPNGAKVLKCDLTVNSELLKEHVVGCDIVYHCAGEIKDEALMHSLHVGGTQRLLNAVLTEAKINNRVIHWVQLSSVGVYGPPSGAASLNRVITELSPLNPVGEYEITKTESDKLLLKTAETGLITYTIVRPSNVFSDDMPNQSIRSLGKMIKKGLFFYIGKSGATATYIHVDDVVELLLLCMKDNRVTNKVFNISNDCSLEQMTIGIAGSLNVKVPKFRLPENLVRLFVSIVGVGIKLPLTQERINTLVSRTVYPYSKLEKELGFSPRILVPDSIGEVF